MPENLNSSLSERHNSPHVYNTSDSDFKRSRQTSKKQNSNNSKTSKLLRVFITLYLTISVFAAQTIALILEICFFLLAIIFRIDKGRRTEILGFIFRLVNSIFVIQLNPFWKLEILGTKPKNSHNASIFMSNHLSNSDPFFICSALLPQETKQVSKASLFKVPIGGQALSLAGDIPIYFTKEKGGQGVKKGSISVAMNYCKQLLKKGISITAFPEGIRSRDGSLKEFKNGMFSLAIETRTNIIPMAISGSGSAQPVGEFLIDKAHVKIAYGKPIIVNENTSLEKLKSEVREEIIRLKKILGD